MSHRSPARVTEELYHRIEEESPNSVGQQPHCQQQSQQHGGCGCTTGSPFRSPTCSHCHSTSAGSSDGSGPRSARELSAARANCRNHQQQHQQHGHVQQVFPHPHPHLQHQSRRHHREQLLPAASHQYSSGPSIEIDPAHHLLLQQQQQQQVPAHSPHQLKQHIVHQLQGQLLQQPRQHQQQQLPQSSVPQEQESSISGYGASQYEQIDGQNRGQANLAIYEGVALRRQQVNRQPHSPQRHHAHSGVHSPGSHKVKELEEARQRIAQMEKTMRWWSDCTNNWRDKWSKARAERNETKEELRKLRASCQQHCKELEALSTERTSLEQEIIKLRSEMHRLREKNVPAGLRDSFTGSEADHKTIASPALFSAGSGPASQNISHSPPSTDTSHAVGEDTDQVVILNNNNSNSANPDASTSLIQLEEQAAAAVDKRSPERCTNVSDDVADGGAANSFASSMDIKGIEIINATYSNNNRAPTPASNEKSFAEELLALNSTKSAGESVVDEDQAKIAYLQLRLQDALRLLQSEKRENERLTSRLNVLSSRESASSTMCSDKLLKASETMPAVDADDFSIGIEEFEAEEKIQMLQVKLEKLQEENATEWQRCERLESEKCALERENKRLKLKVLELEDNGSGLTSVRETMRPVSITTGGNAGSTSSSSEGIGSMGTCGTGELFAGTAGSLAVAAEESSASEQQQQQKAKLAGNELRLAHQKLLKSLQEKSAELAHALRRAEAFEHEVKRLRARIEELKEQLKQAHDELDTTQTNERKFSNRIKELETMLNRLRQESSQLDAQRSTLSPDVACNRLASVCTSTYTDTSTAATTATAFTTATTTVSLSSIALAKVESIVVSNSPPVGSLGSDESSEQPPGTASAFELSPAIEKLEKQAAYSTIKAGISGSAWTSIFKSLVRSKRSSSIPSCSTQRSVAAKCNSFSSATSWASRGNSSNIDDGVNGGACKRFGSGFFLRPSSSTSNTPTGGTTSSIKSPHSPSAWHGAISRSSCRSVSQQD